MSKSSLCDREMNDRYKKEEEWVMTEETIKDSRK
jgi:hypothetical protein